MNEPSPIVVAGRDVGKSKLDVHLLDGGVDRVFRNDKCGRRVVRNWLLRHGVTCAVFGPAGRCHRNLHQCLADVGIETVLVNPLRSRRFAEALGRLAKNDRVDAGILARFGLLDDLAATPPRAENLRQLSDLLALRRKLLDQLGALRKLRAELDPQTTECSAAAREAHQAGIAADAVLSRRADSIGSVPGCGRLTAACLFADMPELGTPGRRHAASLLGLAPQRPRLRTARGRPRQLPASPFHGDPIRDPLGVRLPGPLPAPHRPRQAHKVAKVAVMRRPACLLDTLLRDDRLWQAEPPCPALQAAACSRTPGPDPCRGTLHSPIVSRQALLSTDKLNLPFTGDLVVLIRGNQPVQQLPLQIPDDCPVGRIVE